MITGVVTDASGAVVPGASATIFNKANQFTTRQTTSGAGAYNVSGLSPGVYEMRVGALGFKTTVIELKVEVGRVTSADVQLKIGELAETVTVEVRAGRVNPTQTALEGIVTENLIRNLPLNGRNFLDLGQLEPGVQLNPVTLVNKGAYSKLSISVGRNACCKETSSKV
jgi:hypothetical protein